MKWPIKISVVVMMVNLLAGETSSQHFSPYFPAGPVYPASTFPLHQFPYHSALRLHHPVIPHHFNVRTSSGSSNVRQSTPFRNSKLSPFLSNFLTRTGPHTPGYGAGVIVV